MSALADRAKAFEPGRANVRICPLDLIVVVVDAEDRSAGKSGYRPHRATDTAAGVENVKSWPEPKPQGDEMLEAGRRLTHRLAFEPGGKVERVSPTIFVEICHQIVEMVDDRHVIEPALQPHTAPLRPSDGYIHSAFAVPGVALVSVEACPSDASMPECGR